MCWSNVYTNWYETPTFCGETPDPVTCTVAEYVPRAMLLATGVSVSVAGADAELSCAFSQLVAPAPYDTVTCKPVSAPRPPFVIATVCPIAVPMPCVATKVRELGDTAIVGGGTTNVTATFSGLFVALGAETGTFAVYVPFANEPTAGCSVSVDGVDVAESVAVNQFVADPLYSIGPTVSPGITVPLTLNMLTGLDAGLPLPLGAVKDSLPAFVPRTIAEPMVNVTLSDCGAVPGAVEVIGTDAV